MTSFDAITGILTDYEGNQYSTKVLGGKRWMTQNLRSLRKSDGSFIDCHNGLRLNPGLNNGTSNSSIIINDQLPIRSISFKENNITVTVLTKQFVFKFGLAYNQGQALTACPRGWHLPTEAEWNGLATAYGGNAIAGKKLKANDYTYESADGSSFLWSGYNISSVDNSGFNALPAGDVDAPPTYLPQTFARSAYWWTATSATTAHLTYDTANLHIIYPLPTSSYSVRCVQD